MKKLSELLGYACLLAVIFSAVLVGCGGGGGGGGGAASTGVNFYLTDSPACGYDHVYITVDHLEMSSDNGTSWTSAPVSSSLGRIDLLNLTNGVLQTLGQAPLTAGTYNQIRLVLKANGSSAPWNNALVLSGSVTETPLTTPSITIH